jgi:hypothetical protein
MSRLHTFLPVALAVGVTACAHPPRWVASQEPTPEEVEILLETGRASTLSPRAFTASELPDIPVRVHLRPCCAFGSELRASLFGAIPILGYKIPNVIGPDDVGPHTFDSGIFAGTSDDRTTRSFGAERNGLIYTCRGGFIDTAHVRDYVDWAIYFAAQIGRRVIEGGEIVLPDEGGQRRVIVRPLPPELLDRYGLGNVVSTLAQWLSFQASIWHEIATWYGWESVRGFSERASAFSPEDLYSNMLGSKLMLAINAQRQFISEPQFNRAVDGWFGRALELLGAVPADLGREVTRAVDGLWWDSHRRVPDPGLVRRRSFGIGDPIAPWLAPESALSTDLRRALDEACPVARGPVVFANPQTVRGVVLGDYVTLEIDVDDSLARQEPFATRGRRVTQADFAELVAGIVEQARAEFGPRADQPD